MQGACRQKQIVSFSRATSRSREREDSGSDSLDKSGYDSNVWFSYDSRLHTSNLDTMPKLSPAVQLTPACPFLISAFALGDIYHALQDLERSAHIL